MDRLFYDPSCDQRFETKSLPHENLRLEVLRAFLEAAINGLRDRVHHARAELVLNVDEIGVSE
jgi:hypothetical protein